MCFVTNKVYNTNIKTKEIDRNDFYFLAWSYDEQHSIFNINHQFSIWRCSPTARPTMHYNPPPLHIYYEPPPVTPPKCSCNPYSISTPSDRLVQGSSSGSQHIYAYIVQAIILIHSENMGSYNRPIVNMVIYKYYSNLGNTRQLKYVGFYLPANKCKELNTWVNIKNFL